MQKSGILREKYQEADMQKIFRYTLMAVIFLMLLPASAAYANTTEEETVEESEEQQERRTSAEEMTEEPTYEFIPPRDQQPEYESTTEEPYQYYEETTEDYYESVEPSVEETVELPTEEVTEEITEEPLPEPTEEAFVEPETVEEPREVRINQAEAGDFSIRGKVVSDDKGLEGTIVKLTGDKADSVETDEDGNFVFSEVPSGEAIYKWRCLKVTQRNRIHFPSPLKTGEKEASPL